MSKLWVPSPTLLSLCPSSHVCSDDLPDDGFHRIFELLYKIVSRDKPVYLRTNSKPTTQRNAASRLESTAAALRLTVEMGVGKIKFRTALSVLDHIVETLPLVDGSICQPLQSDYFKCFKILLDHAPYCEHMRPKQWQYYVDFTIEALGEQINHHSQTTVDSSHTTTLLSRTGFSQSLRHSDRTSRLDGRKSHRDEEMMIALKNLTATTNAPIMSRAAAIGQCIKRCLDGTSRTHEAVFETVNNIMTVSLTEDVSLSLDLVSSLLPIIRRLWTHKSSASRDQMLILLWSCRHLFLTSSNSWPSLDPGILSNLLETMLSEYSTRNEREILHFDDLRPMDPPKDSALPPRHLHPLRGSARAISNWFALSVMANLLSATMKDAKHDTGSCSPDGPRKRQKLQTPIDNIRQLAVSGQGQSQLAAIQILYFLLDQPNAPVIDITESMLDLLSAQQHEDSSVLTWVYLVFSRCVAPSNPTILINIFRESPTLSMHPFSLRDSHGCRFGSLPARLSPLLPQHEQHAFC